jgi:hypothetical protein
VKNDDLVDEKMNSDFKKSPNSNLCSSAGSSLQILTTHAAHVKELWQDMVALGLYDPELWDTVDLAWEVVLGALNLAASGH